MSKNNLNSGKMGGRHTALIDAAKPVVRSAQKMPEVKKISAGFIKHNIGTGKHRIKIKEMVGGLVLDVRGSVSIQEIRVYTSDAAKTKERLEAEFS